MPRVIHFEIPADRPERAVEFYGKVFGWEIKKYEGQEYWLATTGPDGQPGINGAIMPKGDAPSTVNTIDVPSLDEYLRRIVKAGGRAVGEAMDIPGVGRFSYAADTEGNLFGVLQAAAT